jgi:PTS system mannose-specific IIA component
VIGVVIVTHYRLADELLQAVRLIVGDVDHFRTIGLDPAMQPEEMRSRVDKALEEANSGDGVLVLTDMFGGTPSNVCLPFLEEGRIEVVTGVNLPMLVKLASLKEPLPTHEAAELARDYGRRNISVATDVLAGRERDGE